MGTISALLRTGSIFELKMYCISKPDCKFGITADNSKFSKSVLKVVAKELLLQLVESGADLRD